MATDNEARYKRGVTNGSSKRDFIKHTPFRFVPGYTPEQLRSWGMRQESYPTPVDYGADGKGK